MNNKKISDVWLSTVYLIGAGVCGLLIYCFKGGSFKGLFDWSSLPFVYAVYKQLLISVYLDLVIFPLIIFIYSILYLKFFHIKRVIIFPALLSLVCILLDIVYVGYPGAEVFSFFMIFAFYLTHHSSVKCEEGHSES